jgi:glycine hydroxymethyltransferase
MNHVRAVDVETYEAIKQELERQRTSLELIASENFPSLAVMEAQGSVMGNKYAEGYPGKRYYGGCQYVDVVEMLAVERAKLLFRAEHANVQPHSGTQANMAVYFAVLNPGDTIMGMHLSHGGHLSHGHPMSFSGKYYKVVPVNVMRSTQLIDYRELRALARKHRPRLIVAGSSAYSRIIEWEVFREICDEVNAYLLADIAHYAGLVAAGLYPSPVPTADFVTFTTHKTMRGPRGAVILCKKKHAPALDKIMFPGIQGGPMMHTIAAKAVALKEAMSDEFRLYQAQVIANARAFAAELVRRGLKVVSGGTDCHMFTVDLRSVKMTGEQAKQLLESAGITVNKNTIPYDPQPPAITSGIRIGTPAITARGMREADVVRIAEWIAQLLKSGGEKRVVTAVRRKVTQLLQRHPLYPDLRW